MVLLFALLIGFIIVLCISKSSKNSTASQPSNRANTNTDRNDFGTLKLGSFKDICFALACLVGFSALKDSDELASHLFIRYEVGKEETEVHANGHCWISDPGNPDEYRRLGVPSHIANYLAQLPYHEDSWSKDHALVLHFNRAIGTESTKQRIQEGLSTLPYTPDICQLKSYSIREKDNSTKICIDLTVSRD